MKQRYSIAFRLPSAVLLSQLIITSLVAGTEASGQQPGGSLHDRAKQQGGRLVEGFKADRSVVYPNLTELARRSTSIVIGRTLTNRAHLTTDGNFITTDCSVGVQEVLKGSVRRGSVVLVSLPGGSHRFADGVKATLTATNYRPAEKGRTYLFFLKEKGAITKGLELAGGVQGLYDLDFAANTVVPADVVPKASIVQWCRNKSIKEFLVELHRAVGKAK
ncbi:MAG TPA: hypothetical protein VFV34_20340 [Blastocatellia bacterium]|nr:hypothetical protein [Blastocatellia bacterium]